MTSVEPSRPQPRHGLAALAAATALHALVLGGIGLSAPRFVPPARPADPFAAIQLQVLPPLAAPEPLPGRAAPRIPRLIPPGPSPLAGRGVAPPAPRERSTGAPAETASADFPGFFRDGLPGCGREDMILLTDAERERCRAFIFPEDAQGRDGLDARLQPAELAPTPAGPRSI